MEPKEIQPEIKDIMEMLDRYHAVNKSGVNIIFCAVANRSKEEMETAETFEDAIKAHTYACVTFGELGALRVIHNALRDQIEDNVDEEGWVDFSQVGEDGIDEDLA